MTQDSDKGSFSADIPEDAIAEALEAVEKSARAPRPPPAPAAAPAVEVVEEPAPATPAEPAAPSPLAGEAEKLRAELELSQEHARKVYAQLKDEHDRLLRLAADHENYRKRAQREKDELLRFGNERLVKEILPALDSLDRALALASPSDPLASGIDMTRRLLEDALGRFGVKGFSAKGQAFDPRVHEALMTMASGEEPGTVLEEMQRGFFLHDRLLRPAAVVVAAPPAGEGSAEEKGEP